MRLIPTPPASEEPAPCPWCGSATSNYWSGDEWRVLCKRESSLCGARGPVAASIVLAIRDWNRIASPSKPEREVVVGMSVSEARELIHSIDAPLGNDAAAVVLYRFRDLLRSALTPTEEKP